METCGGGAFVFHLAGGAGAGGIAVKSDNLRERSFFKAPLPAPFLGTGAFLTVVSSFFTVASSFFGAASSFFAGASSFFAGASSSFLTSSFLASSFLFS